ncbi:alpha/beta hydrolase [Planctomyces sp. SH-PL62]|uniref:alpha/beta hydrolase n=1 Tax=Planctomyces sp. SH-PL62 TaxID=1636152 RepID=UPI00078CFC26|nr:alpha/beta fold hydrolase [Planctomyces sp. SH-PL62]AMV38308.1 Thermostable monoacylglycerol lipase [Planctomyces sp. SH-PL62]
MEPAEPAACLAIHGLGGGPYELQPLIDAVRATGRRVEAPALPGHEGPGPVMPASSWTDWTRAAEAWYDESAARRGPTSVVGFSTGALVALHLASRRPVDRLVLIAPFFAIRYTRLLPFRPSRLLRICAKLRPDVPRRGPAVRDPEARRQVAALDRFRTFSLAAAVSALDLIEIVEPLLPAIDAPTLILQGSLDSVVEPCRAARLRERLGSRRKRLVMLPSSDHLAAFDRDRERLIAQTLAFLDEDVSE